jgi:hypothetical protein
LSWPLDGADLLGGIDVEALDVAVAGYRAERAYRRQACGVCPSSWEREQRRARKAAVTGNFAGTWLVQVHILVVRD